MSIPSTWQKSSGIRVISFFGVEIQSNKSLVVGVRNSGFEKMSTAHFSRNRNTSVGIGLRATIILCLGGRGKKKLKRRKDTLRFHRFPVHLVICVLFQVAGKQGTKGKIARLAFIIATSNKQRARGTYLQCAWHELFAFD